MNANGDRTQACGNAAWVYYFLKLDQDTYAVEGAGEISLVNGSTLEVMLRRQLEGGQHGLEGGHVG